MPKFEIGIINCHTGRYIKRKILEDESIYIDENQEFLEKVRMVAQKMVSWFDKQNTFFDGKKIWEVWEGIGELCGFEKLLEGKSFEPLFVRTIAIFPKNSK